MIGCMDGNCGTIFNEEKDLWGAPSEALCRHVRKIVSKIRGAVDRERLCLHRVLSL